LVVVGLFQSFGSSVASARIAERSASVSVTGHAAQARW
jgi:hypothetical protein